MSSVEIVVRPIHSAVSLPSAIIATTVSFPTGCGINAPGDVKPGHMILAPLSTNRIAPLSTCNIGRKKGNLWKSLNVGIQGPSRCLKNNSSPLLLTSSSIWSWLKENNTLKIKFYQTRWSLKVSYHLTILNASFFCIIWSMWLSISGNCSINLLRIPFWTEDLSCCVPETLSFSSNLKKKKQKKM